MDNFNRQLGGVSPVLDIHGYVEVNRPKKNPKFYDSPDVHSVEHASIERNIL